MHLHKLNCVIAFISDWSSIGTRPAFRLSHHQQSYSCRAPAIDDAPRSVPPRLWIRHPILMKWLGIWSSSLQTLCPHIVPCTKMLRWQLAPLLWLSIRPCSMYIWITVFINEKKILSSSVKNIFCVCILLSFWQRAWGSFQCLLLAPLWVQSKLLVLMNDAVLLEKICDCATI